MDIKNVELIHYDEIKPGTKVDGLPVPTRPEAYGFKVTVPGADKDETTIVPNDPSNPHYQAVAEWYGHKKSKPFDFDFVVPKQGKVLPVLDADDPKAARPTVTAEQTAPAELPEYNLTNEQLKEITGS